MNARYWEKCNQPERMLRWLIGPTRYAEDRLPRGGRVKPNARMRRLFLCAAARLWWLKVRADGEPLIDGCRHLVELAEKVADESAEADGLHVESEITASAIMAASTSFDPARSSMDASLRAAGSDEAVTRYLVSPSSVGEGTYHGLGRAVPTSLVRCLFGNPFKLPELEPRHFTTNAVQLAQAIYEGRRLDDVPILADGAEESGVTDSRLLDHLRGPGVACPQCFGFRIRIDGIDGGRHPSDIELSVKSYCGALRKEVLAEEIKRLPCPACRGSGAVGHFRGCWALDCFLGLPRLE